MPNFPCDPLLNFVSLGSLLFGVYVWLNKVSPIGLHLAGASDVTYSR
jgi:hypothetical protein